MNALKICTQALLWAATYLYAAPSCKKVWVTQPESWINPTLSMETCNFLANAPIQSSTSFGSDRPSYQRLELGTEKIQAFFKPCTREHHQGARKEVAAYRLAVQTGLAYVPPVVLREVNGQWGSCQLFVKDAQKPTVQEFENSCAKSVLRLKLFWYILGHWDTHLDNVLTVKTRQKTYPISIDHEWTTYMQHSQFGDAPFVRRIKSDKLPEDTTQVFPFNAAESIQHPNQHKLHRRFEDAFPDWLYTAIEEQALSEPRFNFVIFQKALWQQHIFTPDNFVPPYTTSLSEASKRILTRLNRRTLKAALNDVYTATFRRLYEKVKHLKNCRLDTDDWDAFAKILPKNRHIVGKKHTLAIERDNTRHHP